MMTNSEVEFDHLPEDTVAKMGLLTGRNADAANETDVRLYLDTLPVE